MLIRHKLSKANFVLNALLRLLIIDNPELEAIKSLTEEGELDALFAYNTFTNKIAYNKVYNKFNKYYAFAATVGGFQGVQPNEWRECKW